MEVSCGWDNLAFSANAGANRGKVKILPAQSALAAMEKHKRLRLKLENNTMDVQFKSRFGASLSPFRPGEPAL
jgi:hypothetical protein